MFHSTSIRKKCLLFNGVGNKAKERKTLEKELETLFSEPNAYFM